MKLYHVSVNNRELTILDLSANHKVDPYITEHLINSAESFEGFYKEYCSLKTQAFAIKRKWPKEKMAAEALFEFVRQREFENKPSRLVSAYFTTSIENAEEFNRDKRDNQGAIFCFDADENNVFSFDMDLFDKAYKIIEEDGLNEETFWKVKNIAKTYWGGYESTDNKKCEILYHGMPILKRCKWRKIHKDR